MCTCMSLNVLPIFINIQCIVHTVYMCIPSNELILNNAHFEYGDYVVLHVGLRSWIHGHGYR